MSVVYICAVDSLSRGHKTLCDRMMLGKPQRPQCVYPQHWHGPKPDQDLWSENFKHSGWENSLAAVHELLGHHLLLAGNS